MIPNFDHDDERIQFIEFIQENVDIFDELIRKTRNRNFIEGYNFSKEFNLHDDANTYALVYDLEDFNINPHETDINIITGAFNNFLQREIRDELILKLKEKQKLFEEKVQEFRKKRASKKIMKFIK